MRAFFVVRLESEGVLVHDQTNQRVSLVRQRESRVRGSSNRGEEVFLRHDGQSIFLGGNNLFLGWLSQSWPVTSTPTSTLGMQARFRGPKITPCGRGPLLIGRSAASGAKRPRRRAPRQTRLTCVEILW